MGYLKLFRFMSVVIEQTKCKVNKVIPQTVPYSEKRNWNYKKYYEETTELEKYQSEISPGY